MANIAGNLMDYETGSYGDTRYLIMDKDPLYITAFREIIKFSGIDIVKLTPDTPWLNAYADRFVQLIKTECLDNLILIGEGSLR